MSDDLKKKMLVIGGGIVGLEAAIQLRGQGFAVELVSERDYVYFYPNSIWIPTGERKSEDLRMDLQKLAATHGFTFRQARVEQIDQHSNRVIAGGSSIDYDYLIIALGAGRLRPKGVEHTFSICGDPLEAVEIGKRVERLVAMKKGRIAVGFGGNPKDSSAVRGGPGFEVIFNIHTHLKRQGIRPNFELTFFAPMPQPGARLGPKALAMMGSMFRSMNIATRFGKKISGFEAGAVSFEDESRLEADLILFIPALAGHPVVTGSDLPQSEAGFIRIDDLCRVEGSANIFAVGDVAELQGPDWRAKQAHVGEMMARAMADNIAALERGEVPDHRYNEHLNVICVMDSGNGAAYVYRDERKARMIPLPVVGHWLKKGFGLYYRLSRKKRVPRLPGL